MITRIQNSRTQSSLLLHRQFTVYIRISKNACCSFRILQFVESSKGASIALKVVESSSKTTTCRPRTRHACIDAKLYSKKQCYFSFIMKTCTIVPIDVFTSNTSSLGFVNDSINIYNNIVSFSRAPHYAIIHSWVGNSPWCSWTICHLRKATTGCW